MPNYRINVVIDPKNAQTGRQVVDKELNKIGKTADKVRSRIAKMLAGIGTVFVVRKLIQYADAYTLVQNRLKLVTNGQEELIHATEQLFKISDDTRSSFEATAEVYARVGLASKELGITQERLLNFTKSLNQAVLLSGASATEAQAGLIQLSQGLASGALRGDELRSVLEQLPAVADVISKSMGITRGQLREMGAQGKITAEIVLNAFEMAREELDEKFGRTVPTLGQSFQVLANRILKYVGQANESAGVTRTLSGLVMLAAKNVDALARSMVALTLVIGVHFVKKGIAAAIEGLNALRIALLANPLTAIAVVLTTAISLMVAFGDKIRIGAGRMANLQDLALSFFSELKGVLVEIGDVFSDVWGGLSDLIRGVVGEVDLSFVGILRIAARTMDRMIGLFRGTWNALVAIWDNFPSRFKEIMIAAVNGMISAFETAIDGIVALFAGLFKTIEVQAKAIGKSFINLGQAAYQLVRGNFEAASDFANQAVLDLRGAVAEVARFPTHVSRAFDKFSNEQLIPLLDNPTELAKPFAEIIMDAFEKGQTGFVQDFIGRVIKGAEDRAKARAAEAAAGGTNIGSGGGGGGIDTQLVQAQTALLDKIRGPQEEFNLQVRALNALFEQGKISIQEYDRALIAVAEKGPKTFSTMAGLLNDIRGPQEEYNNKVNALNQLYSSGLITIDQYAVKLKELALNGPEYLARQVEMLDQIRGPQEEFNLQVQTLNNLLASGKITAQEYDLVLGEMFLNGAAGANTLAVGVEQVFARIRSEAADTAGLVGDAFGTVFDESARALTEFLRTGEGSFQEWASSIMDQLLQIFIRMLLIQAVNAAIPGAGGVAGVAAGAGSAAFGGMRANGGDVQPGRSYMVGERGVPERFVPEQAGRIEPMPAPEVNVKVINVRDPNEIPSAISSPEGERAVLNVIGKNPSRVKRSLN